MRFPAVPRARTAAEDGDSPACRRGHSRGLSSKAVGLTLTANIQPAPGPYLNACARVWMATLFLLAKTGNNRSVPRRVGMDPQLCYTLSMQPGSSVKGTDRGNTQHVRLRCSMSAEEAQLKKLPVYSSTDLTIGQGPAPGTEDRSVWLPRTVGGRSAGVDAMALM